MPTRRKPLHQQVLVITGASSGIGLVSAIHAAARGARVVLVSRDEADLRRLADDITSHGGEARHVVADVAAADALRTAAETAVREFGRIDTWVNNAGVSIYGRIRQVPLEDARRLFETNYWGVVNGSLAALPHLEASHGTLINVGSVLSETAYALQGHYVASKHAVKGFTESLRIELEAEGVDVAVTLIEPAAIDTPYPQHARNYLGAEPQHLPPVYAPEVVAKAILHCAEHPHRTLQVGGGTKIFSLMETFMPRAADRFKAATIDRQRRDRPGRQDDTLYAPRPGDGRARGNYPGHVMRSSLYTAARMRPGISLAALAVAAPVAAVAVRRATSSRRREAAYPDYGRTYGFSAYDAGRPYRSEGPTGAGTPEMRQAGQPIGRGEHEGQRPPGTRPSDHPQSPDVRVSSPGGAPT